MGIKRQQLRISKTGKPDSPPSTRTGAHDDITRESIVLRLSSRSGSGKCLRRLFDEWLKTGFLTGEERPFQRDWKLSEHLRSVLGDFLARYKAEVVLGNGTHRVAFPTPPPEVHLEAFVSGDHAPAAVADCATEEFIGLLGMPWCFQIAKCNECGRYFKLGRAPKESYPYGIHCSMCQRAQASKAALASTQKARVIQKAERIMLAANALANWQEPSVTPGSEEILQKATRENRHEVRRLRLSANWVTRHREVIDCQASAIRRRAIGNEKGNR